VQVILTQDRRKPAASKPAQTSSSSKRHDPIEGSFILTGFTGAGSARKGKICNPDSRKTYAKRARDADGALKFEGYVAFPCRGPSWQPAPDPGFKEHKRPSFERGCVERG
jgi:uncharacterized protein (DUF2147 family)